VGNVTAAALSRHVLELDSIVTAPSAKKCRKQRADFDNFCGKTYINIFQCCISNSLFHQGAKKTLDETSTKSNFRFYCPWVTIENCEQISSFNFHSGPVYFGQKG
jgi:hypothetical protein